MYITNKKINHGIIIISIALVFFAVLSGFLLYGLSLDKKRLIELEQMKREQEFESTQAFAIKKIARETELKRNSLNTFFVQGEKETAEFLSVMEEYSTLLSTVPSITVSSQTFTANGDEQDILQLDISGSSSFKNVFTYIQLLESLPYRISTPEVSVRLLDASDGGDVPEWKIKIKVLLLSYNKS